MLFVLRPQVHAPFHTALCFLYRIDLIERNEDAYAAKQRSLAQVQALAPIGVTPAIMAKIEKQIHDGPDERRKPAKEYFWNRKIVNDTMEEDSVQSTYRMETPKSRTSEGASFSLETPGSQDSTEMVMLDDP